MHTTSLTRNRIALALLAVVLLLVGTTVRAQTTHYYDKAGRLAGSARTVHPRSPSWRSSSRSFSRASGARTASPGSTPSYWLLEPASGIGGGVAGSRPLASF